MFLDTALGSTASAISLRLIGDRRTYQPGDDLAGEYFVNCAEPQEIKSVEVSVLWLTEGKGDEDLDVHYFERITNDTGQPVDFRQSQRFRTQLPNSPLSYEGAIVKIHWSVRIRVFLAKGKESVVEQPFRLGSVPRPRPWKVPKSLSAGDNGESSDAERQQDAKHSDREAKVDG